MATTTSKHISAEIARRALRQVVPDFRKADIARRFEADIMARLPVLRDDQRVIAEDTRRFIAVAAGRRWGKSLLMWHIIVPALLRGERWWYTYPTYSSPGAADTWFWFEQAFYPLKMAGIAHINKSRRLIRLENGGQFQVLGLEKADNLRGPGLDGLVMDEAAFVRDDVWTLRLMPMLTGRGGRAYFSSSPAGKNWFQQVYAQGIDPLMTDWGAYHRTSFDNPDMVVEQGMIRQAVPERVFRQEYMAEFLDNDGAVFRGVREAARIEPGTMQPEAGKRYVVGVDWGRDNDYTVAVVIDADAQAMVDMVRVREVGYHLQRGYIANLYAKWRPSLMLVEENSIGSVNIEEMNRDGLPVVAFNTNSKTKRPLIEGLVLALERGEVAIFNDEVLVNELTAYTMDKSPAGHWRYSAPEGGHDDTVIALALAWRAATRGGGLVLW